MRGGGLAPSDLSGWNCHKMAVSVLAEAVETKWVEVWPFWVSSEWLLSRLMKLHCRQAAT